MPEIVDNSELSSASLPTVAILNGRAVIRLNRPAHHNRIELGDIEVLQHILSEIEKNDAIRVVVLTGAGPTFCAGYDLQALAAGEPTADGERHIHEFPELVNRLETCRVPTICGLNGPVHGGGVDLALACDFRIGVSSMTMAIPAADLGVHYYHGGLRRIVTRLGLGPAKQLLLLSQRMDSDQMVRIGFLDEVVPTAEALQMRINELADTLAGAPMPTVIFGMKRALNRIASCDMESTATDAAWAQTMRSPTLAAAAAKRIAVRRRTKQTAAREAQSD